MSIIPPIKNQGEIELMSIIQSGLSNIEPNIKEIGIAVTHYHQKLGPQYLETIYENMGEFSDEVQKNILRDSITTRCSDLALFIKQKDGSPYIARIKKFSLKDPNARGGIQRYALIIIYPQGWEGEYKINFDIIKEEIQNTLQVEGPSALNYILDSWYNILNGNEIEPEDTLDITFIGDSDENYLENSEFDKYDTYNKNNEKGDIKIKKIISFKFPSSEDYCNLNQDKNNNNKSKELF